MDPAARPIPLWIKIAWTVLTCVVIGVYLIQYGPRNLLWFSDIALIVTAIALWRENPLLAGMMALAVLLPELAWNVGFFGRLLFGIDVTGLAGYMFDPTWPLYLRLLSLFHVPLPVMLVWLVHRLGYDRRALVAQTALAWVVLPATYFLSTPQENINWVYGLGGAPQQRLHPAAYLLLLMIAFPLVFYLPTHILLRRLFKPHGRTP